MSFFVFCSYCSSLVVGLKPYDDYAPHTSLAAAGGNETAPGAWAMFKQCDSAWGSTYVLIIPLPLLLVCCQCLLFPNIYMYSGEQLGTCADTICQAGCAMSSVAMALATKGWKGNPATLVSTG